MKKAPALLPGLWAEFGFLASGGRFAGLWSFMTQSVFCSVDDPVGGQWLLRLWSVVLYIVEAQKVSKRLKLLTAISATQDGCVSDNELIIKSG